jgi:hypothetical protein
MHVLRDNIDTCMHVLRDNIDTCMHVLRDNIDTCMHVLRACLLSQLKGPQACRRDRLRCVVPPVDAAVVTSILFAYTIVPASCPRTASKQDRM